MAANLSFAVELYLKCLCILDTGSYPKGNRYTDLFKKLSAKTRKRIEELHGKACGFDPATLPAKHAKALSLLENLDFANNSFHNFGYSFEKPQKNFGIPKWHILQAIKTTILEFRPDWKKKQAMVPTEEDSADKERRETAPPRVESEKIDAYHIFSAAVMFDNAASLLARYSHDVSASFAGKPTPPHIIPVIPSAVLHAFSLELYFKSLIVLDTGASARGHKSIDLFNHLNEKTRQRLEVLYNESLGFDPSILPEPAASGFNLHNVLEATSDAFQKLRYLFEPATQGAQSISPDVMEAIRKAIMELKPEWFPA